MPNPTPLHTPCTSCEKPWSREAFYGSGRECKDCKRARSRRNRAAQARKLAAFERFVDALVLIASQNQELVSPAVDRGAA